MNILFLSIGGLSNLGENAVYPDLLRYFRDNGHSVFIVCQREKRTGLPTQLKTEYGMQVLRVQTGNITKVGFIEKGLSTLLIGSQFKRAIAKYLQDIKFDIVLYSTPPITVEETVKYIKKSNHVMTYLMLKDIFPQNALDIGVLSKTGVKGIIFKYFKMKEKQLYALSDFIGCMSEANVRFLRENNKYINSNKIEICPNTINPLVDRDIDSEVLRDQFGLPKKKLIFVYGGNFGKPQNVDFIIEVLKRNSLYNDRHFVMCGSGTDFYKIKEYVCGSEVRNVTVIDTLDKQRYGQLLKACDVGLIFLDHRFTIPNFPSRLLDYMNLSMPVLAATDRNTDVGDVIVEAKFGWWCESKNIEDYSRIVDYICKNPGELYQMGKNGRQYLEQHYSTEIAYNQIINAYKRKKAGDL